MNRNQWIVIGSCVALFLGLYLFGNIKKPKEVSAITKTETDADHAHDSEALDIDAYIKGQRENLSIEVKARAEKLEGDNSAAAQKELVEIYRKADKPLAVAHYLVKLATVSGNVEDYINAGDFNSAMTQTAPDDKARLFLSKNALTAYKQAVAIDSTITDNKLRLASAYMDEGSEPMKGVFLLRDIVTKDSNNADAQLLLGKYGIVSGQYDKAISRLEKVLDLRPSNPEAMLLMAEAHKQLGDKTEAVKWLERCKQVVENPEAKKEIDGYIAKIKAGG